MDEQKDKIRNLWNPRCNSLAYSHINLCQAHLWVAWFFWSGPFLASQERDLSSEEKNCSLLVCAPMRWKVQTTTQTPHGNFMTKVTTKFHCLRSRHCRKQGVGRCS